ncbi:hypothetical protein RhiirA4_420219 [Rhizophagus irregularis]|uniref:Uncharacterized protein n=1 Tax=Rhizophagus irregularis TaxID=588596 RepID=A0A2I1GH05_9GLOM|nr:hypothetical protein RhiirA4_420219 [Rhizophagus irregularis]
MLDGIKEYGKEESKQQKICLRKKYRLYDAGMTEERAKGILNAIDNDRFLIRVNFIRENKAAEAQIKKSKSVPVKRKQNAQSSSKKRPRKNIIIDSDAEDDNKNDKVDKENNSSFKLEELEYQERILALKEHEIALREREAMFV